MQTTMPEGKWMILLKSWTERIIALFLTISLGLAGWGLKEIATLKERTSVVEVRQNRGDLALVEAINEMRGIARDGTPSLKAHDAMDQQRDMELRTRIARTEAALDKLTTLTEKWAVAATDIAWIKAELQKRKDTP